MGNALDIRYALHQSTTRGIFEIRNLDFDSTGIQGGVQAIVRFPNGYGASIVNHTFSYGTELAVILFTGPDINEDFKLVYDTSVTDDIIPYISGGLELEGYLKLIEALPPFHQGLANYGTERIEKGE